MKNKYDGSTMAQEEQLKENLKMLHTGLRREKKTQI
jgi:hypothetical protein